MKYKKSEAKEYARENFLGVWQFVPSTDQEPAFQFIDCTMVAMSPEVTAFASMSALFPT